MTTAQPQTPPVSSPAPLLTPPWRADGPFDGSSPLLLASPHSGAFLPEALLRQSRLSPFRLRSLEDAHMGALARAAKPGAVPLLEATHGRAWIDLNRALDDHEPLMLDGALPFAARPGARARAGYGLFPRLTAGGEPIYAGTIAAGDALARVRDFHRPWHRRIAETLAKARRRHGFAVLIDLHSMPPLAGRAAPQLVVGDRFGTSAHPALVQWIEEAFAGEGLRVARNRPYAGGHTTAEHGRPLQAMHAVQLEFDRGLYMNPQTLVPNAGFAELAAMLGRVIGMLVPWLAAGGIGGGRDGRQRPKWPLAAE